jgi:hypothetical protein
MSSDLLPVLVLAQIERSGLASDALRFTVYTALFVVVIGVALFYIMRGLRPKTDQSATAKVRAEFEKGKDALLLAAQAKKATLERDKAAGRAQDKEQKERELLTENVHPELVIGQVCPLSGLTMEEDQELIIDPYTGQGYHYSSFMSDWPVAQPRPKYVYRYPQGVVMKTENLISDW